MTAKASDGLKMDGFEGGGGGDGKETPRSGGGSNKRGRPRKGAPSVAEEAIGGDAFGDEEIGSEGSGGRSVARVPLVVSSLSPYVYPLARFEMVVRLVSAVTRHYKGDVAGGGAGAERARVHAVVVPDAAPPVRVRLARDEERGVEEGGRRRSPRVRAWRGGRAASRHSRRLVFGR